MTTLVTKHFGPGFDFQTVADLKTYINSLDLLALDQDVKIFAHIDIAIPNNTGPITFDKTRRVALWPAAGSGVNELERGTFGSGAAGLRALITRGSYTQVNGGFDVYGFRWAITGNGAGGLTTGSPGPLVLGTPSNIFRFNRFVDTGIPTAGNEAFTGLQIGANGGYIQFTDNLLVISGGTLQPLLQCAGSTECTIARNTFVALGASKGVAMAIRGGYSDLTIRNNLFLNFGPKIIDSGGVVTFCYSNTTPTSGYIGSGLTVNTTVGALVENEDTDYRPKLAGPLIGTASVTADNTDDILGNYRGTDSDIGAWQRTPGVRPVAPNATITSVTVRGQRVTVTGTYTSTPDSGLVQLTPTGTPNGAVAKSAAVTFGGGTFTGVVNGVIPGNYAIPAALFTNGAGTGTSTGGDAFTIDVPAAPTIAITSQTKSGQTVTISGTYTGFPVSGTVTLTAAGTPNGAVTKGPLPITLNDNGTWSAALTAVAYGNYSGSSASATNFSGTATATGAAITLYAPGTQPPGLPAVDLVPYSAPAFNSPLVALDAKVTDVMFESTGGAPQSNVPFTFGQSFNKGDLAPGNFLIGKIAGQADVPLQFNVKSTHFDGSVRHAIISGILPTLAAGATVTMDLVRASSSAATTVPFHSSLMSDAGFSFGINLMINGVQYAASKGSAMLGGFPSDQLWVGGSVMSEWVLGSLPIYRVGADPAEVHPDLKAQFSYRYYPASNKVRMNVVVEHCDAYNTHGDITYDAAFLFGATTAYSENGIVNGHHRRWKKTIWWNGEPQLHIKHNSSYLIASKQVSNYDPNSMPAESLLASYATRLVSDAAKFKPMGPGPFTPFMGETGGRKDIGLMPDSYAATVLSMDKRAKAMMLASADCAGSWSAHFRDTSGGPGTGMPLSVVNFPFATLSGNFGDAQNVATGQNEKLPEPASASLNIPDGSHQPAFAYLPYLLTGDYFYLEEQQFWASYCVAKTNPYFRGFSDGLLTNEQLRGQGWTLRTVVDAAISTPDAHPLKSHLMYFVKNTLAAHNARFTDNPSANTLGINDTDLAYPFRDTIDSPEVTGLGLAPWQDDFFTMSVGHAAELGFTEAGRLLRWKAKFQIGRMLAPGYCSIQASIYSLRVRDSNAPGSPLYTTLAEALSKTVIYYTENDVRYPLHDAQQYALQCGSQAYLDLMNLRRQQPSAPFVLNEMVGYSSSTEGFPANYQPALAYAVDSGYEGGIEAWNKFNSRANKPDYTTAQQFSIVPRSLDAEAATEPGAPTNVVATAGNGTVSVAFTPGPSNGSATTSFTVTASTGQTASGPTSPITIAMPNGVAATFTVHGTNGIGPGPESAPSNSVTPSVPAPATPTVSVTLVSPAGAAAASLTNLKWAWFDQVTPDLFAAPTDKGAVELTDGAGVLTISLPNSVKTSGQIGWLIVTNSDGTTGTIHKAFGGPVAVN